MIPKRVLPRFAIAAAVVGVAASFTAPIASADKLSNGLDVTCSGDSKIHQLACVINPSGCPRVNGDYVVDAVHVMQNGHQDEYEFKCINGLQARHNISTTVDGPITLGFQACRKKDLEGDWCGPWANYTYRPPAEPVAPPPPPPVQCPAGSVSPVVPAGQQCQAPQRKVKCPEGSPTPEVDLNQNCAPIPDVTGAIQASINPGFGKVTVNVTNSSKLNAKCTYDATPFDTHRDFSVNANSSTTLTFNAINTLTSYHVVISCRDASGKQAAEMGHVEQDVTF